jgi:hypothetical protein
MTRRYSWELISHMNGEDPWVVQRSGDTYQKELKCISAAVLAKKELTPWYPQEVIVRVHESEGDKEYPEYISYDKRIASFENWPKYFYPSPPDLAQAGFFYNNIGDKVTCFYCGICLFALERCESVWEAHQGHSPSCYFMYMCAHKEKKILEDLTMDTI